MPDPDSTLTARIAAALEAIRRGGSALADAIGHPRRYEAGLRRRDRFGARRPGALTYVGVEAVTGRAIHRHGSHVARVRYYRVTTSAGQRSLLVHPTAEGSVADFDVVERIEGKSSRQRQLVELRGKVSRL